MVQGRKPGLNTIAKRAGARYEGEPPACPDWLDPVATAEWNRIAPELTARGILWPEDVATLAAYCQTYSNWTKCEKSIRNNGMMIPGPHGNLVLHPAAAHAAKLVTELRQLAGQFGFSPAGRTRVETPVAPGGESNDFTKFLDGT